LSFEIYHYILVLLSLIAAINVLGIVFYPKCILLAKISSLVGILLALGIFLFFLFPFMKTNPPTAITYGVYSLLLLIASLLTFINLIRHSDRV
ncbi:MAG: hypothetical protein AAB583_02520, partial [Patescibacteria group bacterium]